MTLKFKYPPINELVIGTYFDPHLSKLHAEHVGLFWSRIRKEYPRVSQQMPIGSMFIQDPGDAFPLPRFWIISKNETLLMQIQKNAFLFNWRKREEEYPHFEEVKSEFDRNYQEFIDFLKSEAETSDIQIGVCELTYINLIEANDYWKTVGDTSNVVPSFQFIDPGFDAGVPDDFNYVSVYRIDEQLTIKVTIKTAHPGQQPERLDLTFEIRAAGNLGQASKSDADRWFKRAHASIRDCFLGMTNPEIQAQYWQPLEDA